MFIGPARWGPHEGGSRTLIVRKASAPHFGTPGPLLAACALLGHPGVIPGPGCSARAVRDAKSRT